MKSNNGSNKKNKHTTVEQEQQSNIIKINYDCVIMRYYYSNIEIITAAVIILTV